MKRRNLFRQPAWRTTLFFCLLCGVLLYTANRQADGFITAAHDDPEWFANNETMLIKRVHEDSWDIAYGFADDCPDSEKTEENLANIRAALETAIRLWLEPLREISDKPIVDKFNFYDLDRTPYHIYAVFTCEFGKSHANRIGRKITMKRIRWGTSISPDLPYRLSSLLHELGHTFDLADTYSEEGRGESFVSTGNLRSTRGKHPESVMSAVNCSLGLCDDDKKAIQWLYRYHYEGLDPTNCPPDYVYDELKEGDRRIGGCVPRQPLIFEARQGHVSLVQDMLKQQDKNLLINERDKDGNTALHHLAMHMPDYISDSVWGRTITPILAYPGIDINIKNNARNTALHLAARFNRYVMVEMLLEVEGVALNARNLLGMTPLHYAAERGDVDSATLLLAHSNINPNLLTEAGLTALQVAERRDDIAEVITAWVPEEVLTAREIARQQRNDVNAALGHPAWTSPLHSIPSPSELQQGRAEIAALLRAHPGIILPETSDINGDGIVNILDLVKVSSAFGQLGQVLEDVNGDGVVNILDLVKVAGDFGQ